MELLKELGISGGTAIILLIVSYWVIKGAVKNGVIAAFEEITGKDTLKKLLKAKYMNGEEDKYVGITSAAKDISNAAGQLVVATNAEFAPWEYKEGNKYYGIDMEIAQLIANELGLELVIDDMEFDAVVGAVGKQNVDIAMSGITITTERLGVINFSTPYYTESIVCVVKSDNTELDSAGTVVDMLNVICAK